MYCSIATACANSIPLLSYFVHHGTKRFLVCLLTFASVILVPSFFDRHSSVFLSFRLFTIYVLLVRFMLSSLLHKVIHSLFANLVSYFTSLFFLFTHSLECFHLPYFRRLLSLVFFLFFLFFIPLIYSLVPPFCLAVVPLKPLNRFQLSAFFACSVDRTAVCTPFSFYFADVYCLSTCS